MVLGQTVGYALWVVTLTVQTWICVVMIKRGLRREMPFFFAYTAFQVIRSATLLAVRQFGSPASYSYLYWTAELMSSLLGFAVIHELFSVVLQRFQGLRKLGMLLFRGAFVVLVAVAIVSANRPDLPSPRLIAAVLMLERSIRIIQCGLIVFLFMFASTLALSWRHYVFGVALGFGLYAAAELIIAAIRVQIGPAADQAYISIKPALYALSTLVWLGYLLNPIRESLPVKASFTSHVEDWNRTILGFLSE